MKEIDYMALATVWLLPKEMGLTRNQIAGRRRIPFVEAINVLLGLPRDQQERAEIEVHGRTGRIRRDEALAISHRADFPNTAS
jgi:hypothetical protein